MAHLKRSIVEVKTEYNCYAHALGISIAKVDKNPKHDASRKGRMIRHVLQTLLETTDIDLFNEAGNPEIVRFENHFGEYKIFVYHGLRCDNIMFEGQVHSAKRLNILYYYVERYYHVIINFTGAMARKFVSKGRKRQVKSRTPVTRRLAIPLSAFRARSSTSNYLRRVQ